jgi:hypothetical protein
MPAGGLPVALVPAAARAGGLSEAGQAEIQAAGMFNAGAAGVIWTLAAAGSGEAARASDGSGAPSSGSLQ